MATSTGAFWWRRNEQTELSMSMAFFCRFVCGVTPYLPNSHRTSIGIQSFRPKPAPFSSSSTSGYSFRHTLNARTRRPASSRTRAREPRDAMRSSRRNAGAPRRATLHPPKVLASLAVLMAACMGGAAADLPAASRRAAAHRRVARRIQGGARGDRAPEHDRPARGVDDSVRGRSRAHGPTARDVGPGCRHRRRPRRRTPPSFSRGRRGTGSSRSTAPTDPFRAPSPSGARRCGG